MCEHIEKSEPVVRTTVVNLRAEDYDVYIGRAGHGHDGYFGNPHPIGYCRICKCKHDRNGSIKAYKEYFFDSLRQDPEFRARVLDLKGKKLGCFCRPEACHGDVIATYVDTYSQGAIFGTDAKTIGIVGSRRRNSPQDYQKCLAAFLDVYNPGDMIVSGGCPKGGDAFAVQISLELSVPIQTHYPDWQRYGKSAGLRRNDNIARDADVLIAVVAADRRGGTEDTIRKFGDKKPLVIVHENDIIMEGF